MTVMEDDDRKEDVSKTRQSHLSALRLCVFNQSRCSLWQRLGKTEDNLDARTHPQESGYDLSFVMASGVMQAGVSLQPGPKVSLIPPLDH